MDWTRIVALLKSPKFIAAAVTAGLVVGAAAYAVAAPPISGNETPPHSWGGNCFASGCHTQIAPDPAPAPDPTPAPDPSPSPDPVVTADDDADDVDEAEGMEDADDAEDAHEADEADDGHDEGQGAEKVREYPGQGSEHRSEAANEHANGPIPDNYRNGHDADEGESSVGADRDHDQDQDHDQDKSDEKDQVRDRAHDGSHED